MKDISPQKASVPIMAGFVIAFSICVAYAMNTLPETMVLGAALAAVILSISFFSTELSLIILIFSMLLSPELILGSTSRGALSRGVTLRFDDILLSVIGLSWMAKLAIYKNLGLFFHTPLNRPIALYIAVCFFSTWVGAMADRLNLLAGTLYVAKYFQYFFIYFMVSNHLKELKQVWRYLTYFFLTAVIACIFGLAYMPVTKRVSAPFEGEIGEPNTFGGYLVLMLSIGLGIYFHTEHKWVKRGLLAFGAISIVALSLTLSRSSYLSLLAAYLAGIVLFKHKRVPMILALCVAAVLFPFIAPEAVQNRIFKTFKQDRFSVKVGAVALDGSTSARINSYKEVIEDWGKEPILGHGVTGYKFIDAQYMKIIIDTGLLGFAFFWVLIISLFRQGLHSARTVTTSELRGVALGFLAGFFGMLFHSLGTNTFIIVRIMEPFWFLAAIVVLLPQLDKPKQPATAPAIPNPLAERPERPLGIWSPR